MTLKQFEHWLENKSVAGLYYIVSLKEKYAHEKNYRHYNVVLHHCYLEGFEWAWDWHEGEKDVEIIACIPVSAINIDSLGFIHDYTKPKEITKL